LRTLAIAKSLERVVEMRSLRIHSRGYLTAPAKIPPTKSSQDIR
jgi:L-lysine 2,3-aminomutase